MSADASRPRDVRFVPVGTGHLMTRTCFACDARVSQMRGTSQRRTPWGQWVFYCAECAEARRLARARFDDTKEAA